MELADELSYLSSAAAVYCYVLSMNVSQFYVNLMWVRHKSWLMIPNIELHLKLE
jgi:hypothetical protein